MALIECSECKNAVSDKATACPKCGCPMAASNTIAQSATTTTCPKCGRPAGSTDKFCTGCGQAIGVAFPTTSVPAVPTAVMVQDPKAWTQMTRLKASLLSIFAPWIFIFGAIELASLVQTPQGSVFGWAVGVGMFVAIAAAIAVRFYGASWYVKSKAQPPGWRLMVFVLPDPIGWAFLWGLKDRSGTDEAHVPSYLDTVLEGVVITAILAVVATKALPKYEMYKQQAVDAKMKSTLHDAAVAMEARYEPVGNTYVGVTEGELRKYGFRAADGVALELADVSRNTYRLRASGEGGSVRAFEFDSDTGRIAPVE